VAESPGGTTPNPGGFAPENPAPQPPPVPEPPAPERPSIIDAVVDLLQTTVDWLKQEAETTVREKVALPLQKVGLAIGSMAAAGCLLVVGLIFVAIALFMWLGRLITYPGAFMLVGVVYLIGAGVFLVIKSRSMVR
jgi:hypothetical protein